MKRRLSYFKIHHCNTVIACMHGIWQLGFTSEYQVRFNCRRHRLSCFQPSWFKPFWFKPSYVISTFSHLAKPNVSLSRKEKKTFKISHQRSKQSSCASRLRKKSKNKNFQEKNQKPIKKIIALTCLLHRSRKEKK